MSRNSVLATTILVVGMTAFTLVLGLANSRSSGADDLAGDEASSLTISVEPGVWISYERPTWTPRSN